MPFIGQDHLIAGFSVPTKILRRINEPPLFLEVGDQEYGGDHSQYQDATSDHAAHTVAYPTFRNASYEISQTHTVIREEKGKQALRLPKWLHEIGQQPAAQEWQDE